MAAGVAASLPRAMRLSGAGESNSPAELSAGATDAIGTIANMYGFPDQNNFTRAFRNRFNKTASEVRTEANDGPRLARSG
jgi:AraC-like DNA-binding protein